VAKISLFIVTIYCINLRISVSLYANKKTPSRIKGKTGGAEAVAKIGISGFKKKMGGNTRKGKKWKEKVQKSFLFTTVQ